VHEVREATVSGHLYNVLNTCVISSYAKLQVRILTEPKNALVPQYQMLFGMDKVYISTQDPALTRIRIFFTFGFETAK
jgi:ATP-dependent protease Clp ATPase subunit